jgi:hypothetical protein
LEVEEPPHSPSVVVAWQIQLKNKIRSYEIVSWFSFFHEIRIPTNKKNILKIEL